MRPKFGPAPGDCFVESSTVTATGLHLLDYNRRRMRHRAIHLRVRKRVNSNTPSSVL